MDDEKKVYKADENVNWIVLASEKTCPSTAPIPNLYKYILSERSFACCQRIRFELCYFQWWIFGSDCSNGQ